MKGDSFGRVVILRVFATVLSDGGSGALDISYDSGYTEFSSVQPDGTSGFRIKGNIVQVQPVVAFNTNQIKLSIYNLGATSRAIIGAKVGTKIDILAGYQGSPVRIASANILWARTHKEGPDYITEIIAGDAQAAMINGNVNISFKGSVTYGQVINTLIDALAPLQITRGSLITIPAGSYNQGFVMTRSPLIELFEVCNKLGLYMNVVNGQVNIIPVGQGNSSPLIEVSVDTGMIGIPEVKPPGVIGFQDLSKNLDVSPSNDITFTSLLRADLYLGQNVNIVSKFINGQYIISSVTHDFDSWDGPFYSKCEAHKPGMNLT